MVPLMPYVSVAQETTTDAMLAVVNVVGSGLEGYVRLAVLWSCSSQNTSLDLRPAYLPQDAGASIFRIGRSVSWEFSRKYLTSHGHFSPQLGEKP